MAQTPASGSTAPLPEEENYLTEEQALAELERYITPIETRAQLASDTRFTDIYAEIADFVARITKSKTISEAKFTLPVVYSSDLKHMMDVVHPSDFVPDAKNFVGRNTFEARDYYAYFIIKHTGSGVFKTFFSMTVPGQMLSQHSLPEEIKDSVTLTQVLEVPKGDGKEEAVDHVTVVHEFVWAFDEAKFFDSYVFFRNSVQSAKVSSIVTIEEMEEAKQEEAED
jgi:hypothetical protein